MRYDIHRKNKKENFIDELNREIEKKNKEMSFERAISEKEREKKCVSCCVEQIKKMVIEQVRKDNARSYQASINCMYSYHTLDPEESSGCWGVNPNQLSFSSADFATFAPKHLQNQFWLNPVSPDFLFLEKLLTQKLLEEGFKTCSVKYSKVSGDRKVREWHQGVFFSGFRTKTIQTDRVHNVNVNITW